MSATITVLPPKARAHHYARPGALVAPNDPSWRGVDLCRRYSWPTGLKGGGKIGIIELGGAYRDTDTRLYCQANSIALPHVRHVSVGGTQQTNMHDDASGEVALDVQLAALGYTVATGLAADITVYWAPDIAPGVQLAMADGCDVFSISWGMDEAGWGHAALLQMEAACAAAVAKGMIITAAAGDNDSADGGPNAANVDGPACCPSVIACGGTSLPHGSGMESVWNNDPGDPKGTGTGGGFSTVFPPQSWQAGAPHGPGRMVPDIAASADPEHGHQVCVDGLWQAIGGTSAVAPLYAGLFAACGTKLGRIAPKLWLNHLVFNDVSAGDNGMFRARIGPDPCTGLGSPIAFKVAKLLGAV